MRNRQSIFDLMPTEQLEKYIEGVKDARSWHKAHTLLKLNRSEIDAYLKTLSIEKNADMRRRLNIVKENNKKKAIVLESQQAHCGD